MTIASIATAFLLFSLGRSVAVAFTSEVDYAGKDRLVVSSKLSFTQAMPMSYANRIEALEGVEKVAWRQWFGGTYIDRANFFPKWPVPESYFDIFPEFIVSEGGKEAFSRNIQGKSVLHFWLAFQGWDFGITFFAFCDFQPRFSTHATPTDETQVSYWRTGKPLKMIRDELVRSEQKAAIAAKKTGDPPPPTVFASLQGVYWGMIPGGDGLVSWRCCVCWGLAWDGWLGEPGWAAISTRH